MAKVNYEWQVGETDWGDDTEMLGFEPTPARPAPMRRLRHLPRRLVWLSSAATVLLLMLCVPLLRRDAAQTATWGGR